MQKNYFEICQHVTGLVIMRVEYSNDMMKITHLFGTSFPAPSLIRKSWFLHRGVLKYGRNSIIRQINFLFFIQMRRQYVFLINHKESILKMFLAYPSVCGRLVDKFKF